MGSDGSFSSCHESSNFLLPNPDGKLLTGKWLYYILFVVWLLTIAVRLYKWRVYSNLKFGCVRVSCQQGFWCDSNSMMVDGVAGRRVSLKLQSHMLRRVHCILSCWGISLLCPGGMRVDRIPRNIRLFPVEQSVIEVGCIDASDPTISSFYCIRHHCTLPR